MSASPLAASARAVRQFNRFYTQRIGVLGDRLLRSRFSLAEARVLYELANRQGDLTAGDIAGELAIDAGYMSRILGRFEQSGLLRRPRSRSDRRQRLLQLTPRGQRAYAGLDARSQQEVEAMLATVNDSDQRRLLGAMRTIETALGTATDSAAPFVLRTHQPGDIGWLVHRHAVIYAHEYGWDESFEALVGSILVDFLNQYDPQRERSWIAEMDGEIVGSIFVSRQDDRVAKLRLLLVEPKARGHGLGRLLVEEAIRFTRRTGYEKLTLWTNDILHVARGIYERTGFQLVKQEAHHSFGHDLVGQTWELDLR